MCTLRDPIPVVLVFNLELISLGLFVRMRRGKVVDAAFHVVHVTFEATGEASVSALVRASAPINRRVEVVVRGWA